MINVSQTAISSTACIQSIVNVSVPVSGNGVGATIGSIGDSSATSTSRP